MLPNPDLMTSIVIDDDATPEALISEARRWLGWLQWAVVAVVVLGGFRLGLLLFRGPERSLVPMPNWLEWLLAIVSGVTLLTWLVLVLGTLKPLHTIQQLVSMRPLHWPYWLLPVSLCLPGIGLVILGWYVHAVFRATPVKSVAPTLYRGFWWLSVAKVLLLLGNVTFGLTLSWHFNGSSPMPENYPYYLQPVLILDGLVGIATCAVWWWMLAYVIVLLDPGLDASIVATTMVATERAT